MACYQAFQKFDDMLKSMDDYVASADDQEEEDAEEPEEILRAELVRPSALCPVIIHPEIDVELIEASATT
ncbi:hypothetical protein ILYODFUR_014192 [Ilyodon furcidens]|uniref:Uncharacterized protein n=1 Tax=Ilyodon furcidens TaxID=33524 RepID=A0ABV0VH11_9TELE